MLVRLARRAYVPGVSRSDDDAPSASADPPRNFTVPIEERVRALTIGPPAYALRRRRIEDYEAEYVKALVELYDEGAAAGTSEELRLRALERRARSFDVAKMNRLVEAHNRWYPVEANLPMDRHGRFLVGGAPFRPEAPYTPERLVASALARVRERTELG